MARSPRRPGSPRAIRQREHAGDGGRIPIISLTANAMPHQVEACLEAGADLHLAKPITVAALFESIAAAADLAAQAGEATERAVGR